MKSYKYLMIALFCISAAVSCNDSNAFTEYAKFDTTCSTSWGKSIVEGCNGYIGHVKSDTTYSLAPGVDVLEMGYLTDDGLSMELFLFKVQLSDAITMRTTLANDKDSVGVGQNMMDQLTAMKKDGRKVLGGTNADFFSTKTYVPYGVCYRNGVCVKSSFDRTDGDVFAIYKDNTAHCLTADEYLEHIPDIRETVCGRSTFLIKSGFQMDQSKSTMTASNLEPRTCVGVSQDGKTVWLMVVDGRNFYYSNGADLYDLMNLLTGCGVYDAINLDGGGSSTFIVKFQNSDEFSLRNWPSDGGGDIRPVATGLSIVQQ